MTILNYEVHSNVASAKAMIALFKDFAVAQGWSLLHYQVSKQWVVTSGWIAGTEDFLAIKSTGFGAQDLQFRMSVTNEATNVALVRLGAYRGSTVLDLTTGTHPVFQTTAGQQKWNLNSDMFTTFPDAAGGPIETVWFFGNSKILFIIAKTAIDYCVGMSFGSPELYDPVEDEGNYSGHIQSSLNPANYYYNKTLRMPLDYPLIASGTATSFFYDNILKSNNAWPNFVLNTSGIADINGITGGYGHLVRQNSYSEVKPIFKQTAYVQHISDSAYRALGTMWAYRTYFEPIWEIGRHVLYGTDEYILFPGGRTSWPGGYAFRIS